LRAAFADVIRDPAFAAEVKRLSLSVNYASADEVRAAVDQAMDTLDKAGIAEVRDIALNRYFH
jgi:tripartite-type tricarboxylate transporter receptor subunit TctC